MLQFNVYIGQYEDQEEAKAEQIKLNKLGYQAMIFNMGIYWSLRVARCNQYFDAYRWIDLFKKKGFNAFILNV